MANVVLLAMLGFGPLGSYPLGGLPDEIASGTNKAVLRISGLLVPDKPVDEGILIKSTSHIWAEIVRRLGNDWSVAHEISAGQWEEIVAGAFKKAGYDEVVLTPRSGDHGRDVIAIKRGIGCVKIIDSVKAYKAGSVVPYDDVRALLGVMAGEQNVSKGMVTTTADFPPLIEMDPFIKPFLPTRLELMNGRQLQQWLKSLSQTSAQ